MTKETKKESIAVAEIENPVKTEVVAAKAKPKAPKKSFEQKVVADLNELAKIVYNPKNLEVNQED